MDKDDSKGCYLLSILCRNCGERWDQAILRGVAFNDKLHICPNCHCRDVSNLGTPISKGWGGRLVT